MLYISYILSIKMWFIWIVAAEWKRRTKTNEKKIVSQFTWFRGEIDLIVCVCVRINMREAKAERKKEKKKYGNNETTGQFSLYENGKNQTHTLAVLVNTLCFICIPPMYKCVHWGIWDFLKWYGRNKTKWNETNKSTTFATRKCVGPLPDYIRYNASVRI